MLYFLFFFPYEMNIAYAAIIFEKFLCDLPSPVYILPA